MNMSGMKDMKMPKSGKSGSPIAMPAESSEDRDKYPYGLRIRLGDDEVKKLGCGECKAGDEVHIMCFGKIIDKNIHDKQKGSDTTMEIQIQKMSVQKKNKSDIQKIMDGEKRSYTK